MIKPPIRRIDLARAGRRAWRLAWLALHLAAGVLLAAALGAGRRRYVSTRPLQWWSRGLCRILGIRLRVQGAAATGATLFVANHISWIDIFCIAAVCPTQFLAKQEVASWPLFGWLCRRAGTAFIQRGGGAQGAGAGAGAALEQLAWRLRRGERVLLFPEGTSTTGDTVRRFHPRLFQAAILADCPVQAIALRYPHPHLYPQPDSACHRAVPFVGDDALLPHLWRLLGEADITAELSFGPLHRSPHPSRDGLARQTQAEIAALALPFGPMAHVSASSPITREIVASLR